jgi:hypothetical protein
MASGRRRGPGGISQDVNVDKDICVDVSFLEPGMCVCVRVCVCACVRAGVRFSLDVLGFGGCCRYENIQNGEPAELLVLSNNRKFDRFKVRSCVQFYISLSDKLRCLSFTNLVA